MENSSPIETNVLPDNHTMKTDATEYLSIFMAEVETFLTYKIASYINQYWFPILVPIGLVGNTLSFLVMIKPNNKKVSTCIYMAAISINDNFMMCLALYYWLVIVVRIHGNILWDCRSLSYLVNFSLQCSTYLVLAMTVDKYIAVKWPHRAAIHSAPRKAKNISCGVIVCVMCYNIPHLFASNFVGNQCVAYVDGGTIIKVFSWLSFIVNGIIPFSMLIYMNSVIVRTVSRSRKMFRTNTVVSATGREQGQEMRQKTMKSAENQLTIMLLLVTMLLLILLIPTNIRFIYLTFTERDTPAKYASSMLFFQITFKLYTTNNGINFFLYCLSGRKFRNDLKEILCSVGKSSALHSETTTRADEPESEMTRSSTISLKRKKP